jgi:hypothetical protein
MPKSPHPSHKAEVEQPTATPSYEYRVEFISLTRPEAEVLALVNALGSQGWQLLFFTRDTHAWFMRPI